MLRSHYTIPLRSVTQSLRNSFTQCYTVITQLLYASIRRCYSIPIRINLQLLRNSNTQCYAIQYEIQYEIQIHNSNTHFQYVDLRGAYREPLRRNSPPILIIKSFCFNICNSILYFTSYHIVLYNIVYELLSKYDNTTI